MYSERMRVRMMQMAVSRQTTTQATAAQLPPSTPRAPTNAKGDKKEELSDGTTRHVRKRRIRRWIYPKHPGHLDSIQGLLDVEGTLPDHFHWALSFNTNAILAKFNVN